MTTTTEISRKKLRAGSALQALALLGAGLTISAGLAAPAAAQDYTNVTASGRIQGTDGRAISGATIAITSDNQGFTRTVTAGPDGSYRVPQLPAGTYTFTVSADGYNTYTESGIPLTQTGAANQFTLASASATATDGDIVVTAGRVQVADFDRTTTGSVINVSDIANRVPVARDLTSIIQLSPGTAVGDSAFGNLSSIAGSSVAENQYYVNGLNITNFRNFLGANSVPFEFYDTVEVKNGGYQAEFGRSTGGVVNTTTKSGSNEFHAGAVVTWEPRDLADTQPNTLTQDNDADYSEDIRADFYVSGPVIKDHLFFYALYESRFVNSGAGTTPSGGAQFRTLRDRSPFFAGKVDAVITDGQRLEFTYFRTTAEQRYRYFSYDSDNNQIGGYLSNNIQELGGDNYVGRYTGTFTDWLTVSAAYGRSNDRENLVSDQPNRPGVFDYRTDDSGPNIGNPAYNFTTNEDKREFYRGDIDLYVNLLGSHHFRGGYDRENLETIGTSGYNGGSYYELYNAADVGDYAIRRTFIGGGSFNSKNEAFYLQDSWSLFANRVTLQLGIRNDRFENKNANGVTFYKSGNQWGPRVGFTVDPLGDGRSKLYGSFGRYFLPIAANTNIRLAGAEYDVRDYFSFSGFDANGAPILGSPINNFDEGGPCLSGNPNQNCSITADGTVAETATTVATNLKPQSVDEYILGAEQRIGRYWRVGVYGTWRNLNNALEDAAIDSAAIAYCQANNLGCEDLYTGFSQYTLINPGSDVDVTLLDGTLAHLTAEELGYPKAERLYKAITLTIDREFDGVWSLSGSYTFGSTRGNYEGAVKSDIGQSDAGLTQDFDQPGFTYGAYGFLPTHHAHTFKLYGSVKPTDWLVLGANAQAISPRKYGCIGRVPPSVDPFAGAYGVAGNYCRFADGEVSNDNPIVLVPRGTAFSSDWQTSIDLSAAITLPTDAFEGVVRFDVFNVLNSKAAIDLTETGGLASANVDRGGGEIIDYPIDSTYRTPTQYQEARYARIQLQLRF